MQSRVCGSPRRALNLDLKEGGKIRERNVEEIISSCDQLKLFKDWLWK